MDQDIFLDDENDGLLNSCPNCGKEYDEIDREYQICHYCNHNANQLKRCNTIIITR